MNLIPIAGPNVLSTTGWTFAISNEPGSARATHAFGDSRIDRTYTVRFKAVSLNANAGPLQCIAASGIRIGDIYQFPFGAVTENDTGSFVLSITAEGPAYTDAKGYQYTLTVECGPTNVAYLFGSSDLSNSIINPTDMRVLVYFDSAKYRRTKPTDESTPPKPFINTIGDPLLDPPDTEETRPVLKVVRNETQYNDAYASQFKDTVNVDVFLGYPPNTVKCRDIKGERFYDPDWGYWYKITYEFEFRDDVDGNGFTKRILNAGYRYLKGGVGSPINIVDANGQQVTDAWPLQANGDKLPQGQDPFFQEFAEFPGSIFELLNIDESIFFE